MKSKLFITLAGFLACTAGAWAAYGEKAAEAPPASPFYGSVGAVTDYISRGLTGSRHGAALQAGTTYLHPTGLYGNLWGSTIDLGTDHKNNIELDLRAGYSGQVGPLSYDLAYIGYVYPGTRQSDHLEFAEWLGKMGYDFGLVKPVASVYWSNNFQGNLGYAVYSHLEAAVPLPANSDVHIHYGWSRFSNSALQDYDDWMAGVKKSAWGVDFNLDYTDTHGLHDVGNIGDPRLVFSVIRNF